MKTKPKQYTITNFMDLLDVPADRRKICLGEIEVALKRTEEMLGDIRAQNPEAFKLIKLSSELNQFVWIDDGERDELITVNETVVHKIKGKKK